MRLRGVPPLVLEPDELARRPQRYSMLAPVPIRIEMVNLTEGPRRLETDEDVRWSDEEVYREAMRTSWADYDGVLLDCVLDPALERLERDAPVPVGITRLTAGYLAGLGHRFAAVARNAAIARELARGARADRRPAGPRGSRLGSKRLLGGRGALRREGTAVVEPMALALELTSAAAQRGLLGVT